ncbi:hypothetical protein J7E88_02695 [Streptomyces sp. ISL-10]|uniref:hypothetical protein n=1 Tax=Streptomyces sp. ISL-10 TaxID=2819172 RepID=UPI001BE5F4C4|nr:hypothetical protein [Streptomyces sp. ISL-10]MBT2364266.1 hypothetical protein [Streptomyces sp. ISL-10]
MEIGSLVEQRDHNTAGRIGTVRELDETGLVVQWVDGVSERLPFPVPETVFTLEPGSVRYRAATDLQALQEEFDADPVEVLAQLLREQGQSASIGDLRKLTESLSLKAGMSADRWSEMRGLLLEHPHVTGTSRGPLRWVSQKKERRRTTARRMPASEALRQLAGPPRTVTATTRRALRTIVSAGLNELSPYEQLAAHALDVPIAEWPHQWTDPNPEGVPEEVRVIAVKYITEVSRARRRIVLPGTQPNGPANMDAGPPSALPLAPLLVPLVAIPAPSLAADRAAKAVKGKDAWACGRLLMDCFEQATLKSGPGDDAPTSVEHLRPLLERAPHVLRSALVQRPSEDDGPWLEFAEEMAVRACALLARPRLSELPHGPVHEWCKLVAEYPAIPKELRSEAAARQRASQSHETAATLQESSEAFGEAAPAGDEAQAGDGHASPVASITTEPAAEHVPGHPSQAEPRDSRAEISSLTHLLEAERSNAEAARAQHERDRRSLSAALAEAEAEIHRLRLNVADREQQLAASEERIQVAEAKWESSRRELTEAKQRVEGLTLAGRRRDDELRQARQTVRGASQAQLRQAKIDTLRVLAEVLGEVADQAVHEADDSGATSVLYRRVLARAAAAGVLDIGTPGEEAAYDPLKHRAPGGPSARVVVERPGFVWQGPHESDQVVLEPIIVRQAEQ